MRIDRRGFAVGALAILLLTAGCLGGVSEGDVSGDMTEDEFNSFLTEVEEQRSDLNSYTITMAIEAQSDGRSVTMDMTGDIDHEAQEAYMEMDMSGMATMPGQPTDASMYITENYMYIDEGNNDDWMRTDVADVDEELWSTADFTSSDPMYKYGSVHVTEDEEYITVTTTLTSAQYNAAVAEMDDEVVEEMGNVEFNELEVVERYDAETKFPVEITMTGDADEQGQTVHYTQDVTIENHGDDLDTTVPDEIKDNATTSSSNPPGPA